MTLVDTSVWIDHFRSGNQRLSALLEVGQVLTHDWLSRERTFALLDRLPKATAATDLDLRGWIESRQLWGRGIGWVDAHLAASALLPPCSLWTLDARLRRMAAGLGVRL